MSVWWRLCHTPGYAAGLRACWDGHAGEPVLKKMVRPREHGLSLLGLYRVVRFLSNRLASQDAAAAAGGGAPPKPAAREVVSVPSQKEVTQRALLALKHPSVAACIARLVDTVTHGRGDGGGSSPIPVVNYNALMKSLHAALSGFLPEALIDDVLRYDYYKVGSSSGSGNGNGNGSSRTYAPPPAFPPVAAAAASPPSPRAPALGPPRVAPATIDVPTFMRRLAEIAVLWTFDIAPSMTNITGFFEALHDRVVDGYVYLLTGAGGDGVRPQFAVPASASARNPPTLLPLLLPPAAAAAAAASDASSVPRLAAVAAPSWLRVNAADTVKTHRKPKRTFVSPLGQSLDASPGEGRATSPPATARHYERSPIADSVRRVDHTRMRTCDAYAVAPIGSPLSPGDIASTSTSSDSIGGGATAPLAPQPPPGKAYAMKHYTRPRPQQLACNTLKGKRPHQYYLPMLMHGPVIPLVREGAAADVVGRGRGARGTRYRATTRRVPTAAEGPRVDVPAPVPPSLPMVADNPRGHAMMRRVGSGMVVASSASPVEMRL